MAKYKVDTENGSYMVETEDPAPADSTGKPYMQQPEGSAVSRAAGGLWDTTLGGLGKAAKMLYHFATPSPGGVPNAEAIQDAHDLVQAHMDQWKKARETSGSESFGHYLAAVLPAVGPAAANAAERIGGNPGQLDKYGNVAQQGQSPDVAGGAGEAAGLILSSSPKNIVEPALGVAGKAASAVIPDRITPEGIYQSSLRPSLAARNRPKISSEVQTGLQEGIPVTKGGLEKLGGKIEDVNQEIADKIADKSQRLGPSISPRVVANKVNDLRPTFENQVNPEADLSALTQSQQEFMRKHSTQAPYTQIGPNPYAPTGSPPGAGGMVPTGKGVAVTPQRLTLEEAQAEKQGTYRQLRKKYGELGSADVEAQKSLARGLKDEIARQVPEISALNARDSAMIDLQNELEKMVAREGNKNLLGLVPATMARNPFGFLSTLMLDNPAIKSRIAIAMARARNLRTMPNMVPALGGAAVAGSLPPSPALLQPPGGQQQ